MFETPSTSNHFSALVAILLHARRHVVMMPIDSDTAGSQFILAAQSHERTKA